MNNQILEIYNKEKSEQDLRRVGNGKTKHKTRTVLIKGQEVEIDEKIIGLVNWFNSFEGIETKYSCHGDIGNYEEAFLESSIRPYIAFDCKSIKSMKKIISIIFAYSAIHHNGTLRIAYEYFTPCIECYKEDFIVFRWTDQISMLDFYNYIK